MSGRGWAKDEGFGIDVIELAFGREHLARDLDENLSQAIGWEWNALVGMELSS